MMEATINQDTFARDHLPPEALWPQMTYPEGSVFDYPQRLNCAVELLDKMVDGGHADSPLIHTPDGVWTYAGFLGKVNRIAQVLVEDFGLVPGNRVLMRGPNTPMLAACHRQGRWHLCGHDAAAARARVELHRRESADPPGAVRCAVG